MRTLVFFWAFGLFMAASTALALQVEGVHIPETMAVQDMQLRLNGAGIRTKFFFNLYVGALYLKAPRSEGSALVKADEPMAIRLHVLSKLITSEKMEKATREGFVQSTEGNTAKIEDRIETFIAVFKEEEIAKGDVFDLIYLPGQGTLACKNQGVLATVPGLDFKKALFGIWLSDHPVQTSLKQGMLGISSDT